MREDLMFDYVSYLFYLIQHPQTVTVALKFTGSIFWFENSEFLHEVISSVVISLSFSTTVVHQPFHRRLQNEPFLKCGACAYLHSRVGRKRRCSFSDVTEWAKGARVTGSLEHVVSSQPRDILSSIFRSTRPTLSPDKTSDLNNLCPLVYSPTDYSQNNERPRIFCRYNTQCRQNIYRAH